MASWPDYLEVAETLQKELWAKLDMENLSKEKLVAAAVALRERFWQAGGCLSRTSYPYGYGARILFEIAHEENPHDMAITDELVEALQSIDIVRKYDPDSDEKTVNIALRDTLIALRTEQFDQIVKELDQGRGPVWADFVRVNDLALLLGLAGEYESALELAKWLIANAESGGWREIQICAPPALLQGAQRKRGDSCSPIEPKAHLAVTSRLRKPHIAGGLTHEA
jgi:hypothetical protein